MEKKEYITNSLEETQSLAREFAGELIGGETICLDGELGAGKTAFAQGLLAGLGAEGPYTSPTFLIMKQYGLEISNSKLQKPNKSQTSNSKLRTSILQTKNYQPRLTETTARRCEAGKPQTIYHIDAYRIREDDLLNLGWEEIAGNKNNIIIMEWPERVRKIIPPAAIEIRFEWTKEDQRKITFV